MSANRLTVWDCAALVVTAFLGAAGAYLLRYAPDAPVPMHFDLHGRVDRWGDRGQAALVVLVCAAVALGVHLALNSIAARATLDRNARRVFATGRLIGLAGPVTVALPIAYLGAGLSRDLSPDTAATVALMGAWVIVALAGVSLGKATPNPWVGMRVYWTCKSRLAWDKSNRLLGRIYFLGGIAGLVLTPFGDFAGRSVLFVAVVVGGVVASMVEAWRAWRVDPERTA